jgi:Na+-translocating ferredoxin:NAD+ oxidoreductase RnfD subunit
LTTFLGRATFWGRWLWSPLLLFLLGAVVRGWFRGRAWLLPLCALGTIALLICQTQGVMEARFRVPIDAIAVAAAVCALYFRFGQHPRSGGAQPGRTELTPLPQLPQ